MMFAQLEEAEMTCVKKEAIVMLYGSTWQPLARQRMELGEAVPCRHEEGWRRKTASR
jgi:hypothetical protein